MCAIFGALLHDLDTAEKVARANTHIQAIVRNSVERGRDGIGWTIVTRTSGGITDKQTYRQVTKVDKNDVTVPGLHPELRYVSVLLIGNTRAEPTTEYVEEKGLIHQQPYTLGPWNIVHNGTVANDKELATNKHHSQIDSARIVEALNVTGFLFGDLETVHDNFRETCMKIVGSYAILATHTDDSLHVGVNYRPLWYVKEDVGYYFASSETYFRPQSNPIQVEPYTEMVLKLEPFMKNRKTVYMRMGSLRKSTSNNRVLVIASGGMDSTVVAQHCIKNKYDVTLLHFTYGCRAEKKEVDAVKAISKRMGVPRVIFPMNLYEPGDSPILNDDSNISGGEAGTEYAHEWVPARNLVMLAVATAYAEAKGFGYIALGNNLEEAGAYPDNEPEFINRMNKVLPYAVGVDKRVQILMPVGNLMKHEIVKMGLELGAPLDLTWSCYRQGDKHCGKCGPCNMRKIAFEINNTKEVITYEA